MLFWKAEKHNIKNLLKMAFHEDVEIHDGIVNSTDSHCGSFPNLCNCIHHQIFFKEEGVPIYMFRTKQELLKALIDILESTLHY